MSRGNRVMMIVEAMSDEERADLFERLDETYCLACGEELPDEDSSDPDHDCPFAGEDGEAEGDEGDPEETDDAAEEEPS